MQRTNLLLLLNHVNLKGLNIFWFCEKPVKLSLTSNTLTASVFPNY